MAPTQTQLTLPPLTEDLEEAKAQLAELGVARIANALSAAEIDELLTRLKEQAAGEAEAGLAFFEGDGSNQRVWNLPSKGDVFLRLLRHPLIEVFPRHLLDGDFCLSSYTANIAGPGGDAMVLHSDQGYAPRDIDVALTMNIMWMLVDFTEENGATRLVPGSHLRRAEPPRGEPVETVAGVGPAGTALVFDGRMWHGTGANVTADARRYGVLSYFCRPWMRPQENYTLSTEPGVLAAADRPLRELLGFRVWRTLGGVQGPWGPGSPGTAGFRTDGIIDRPSSWIGEMHPRKADL